MIEKNFFNKKFIFYIGAGRDAAGFLNYDFLEGTATAKIELL